MPESKGRNKPAARPPQARKEAPKASPPWHAPVMVALFLIGLLWIVMWYLVGTTAPVMKDLGNWNLVVGFSFIMGGFFMSTKWR